MASVVEIHSKVPLKKYLMENAIVTYSLALWRIPFWQNIIIKTLRPILELSTASKSHLWLLSTKTHSLNLIADQPRQKETSGLRRSAYLRWVL